MERRTYFADVLLPLPLKGYFTYRIPNELADAVKPGQRVVVQFGKKKIFTALVRRIHENIPAIGSVKYVLSVLDILPIVNEIQFKFWEWIASYYLCTEGEVMNAALPSALKLASESKIILNPLFDGDVSAMSEKELLVLQALQSQQILTLSEVAAVVDQIKVFPLIKGMIEKNVVLIEEELQERYKPKVEVFVRLAEKYHDEKSLNKLFDTLNKRAYRQLEILMSFVQLSQLFSGKPQEVKRNDLIKTQKDGASPVASLIKKEILEAYQKTVSRLDKYSPDSLVSTIDLNAEQMQAIEGISLAFETKDVALLHGVTSSGKTEIYIKLISQAIAQGKQVLYLLPEIALTSQIINRLRKYFGDTVGVYHSRYSDNERVEIWNSVAASGVDTLNKTHKYQVVLGARSALFMPFSRLGLIIVDEEHDASYKQNDPAPRYHARDSAIRLAGFHKAKVVLGSATPSVESYHNATIGKFALLEMSRRYGGIQLPEIQLVDIKTETRFKRMKSIFSQTLLDEMEKSLANKEQVILFQNRRGFSLRLECDICNWIPQCKNCDVSLIYHKNSNLLRCHYCGYSISIPERCPDCGNTKILMKGFGTEKVEEELAFFFPKATIVRMDLDTTRSRYSTQQIISDFEDGRIDVLVGTQMVTKGLDFDNVSLVGILNADAMLTYPDFRAYERSFQLMAQVSGRAGRKNKQGKVIIQTYNPQHPVLRQVIGNDYLAMYRSQMTEREKFNYPPYTRLIRITMKHHDYHLLNEAAKDFAERMRKAFGKRVLGPEYPPVSRIKNQFLKNILIKTERGAALAHVKTELLNQIERFTIETSFKAVKIILDVDPA